MQRNILWKIYYEMSCVKMQTFFFLLSIARSVIRFTIKNLDSNKK